MLQEHCPVMEEEMVLNGAQLLPPGLLPALELPPLRQRLGSLLKPDDQRDHQVKKASGVTYGLRHGRLLSSNPVVSPMSKKPLAYTSIIRCPLQEQKARLRTSSLSRDPKQVSAWCYRESVEWREVLS